MYKKVMKMAKTPVDDEIEALVSEAQQTFNRLNERAWLLWAGARLMLGMMRKVEEEEAEAAHVEKEQ
jgi:hypothetical protein